MPRCCDKFGLGQRTGVGLPGESAGLVPPIDQWSGSTFSNLPIGQGLSMTLLQMTGMYQAIANDGVRDSAAHRQGHHRTRRHPHRASPARRRAGGLAADRADGAATCCARTAATRPDGHQQGTGSQGAVEGYQISGRPAPHRRSTRRCGCYYSDVYWITFAGMVTTDNPRYVIGIMADNPHRTADGQPGTTMAPLFHNIASWLLQRENIPLSPDPGSAADAAGHLTDRAAARQAGTVSWP